MNIRAIRWLSADTAIDIAAIVYAGCILLALLNYGAADLLIVALLIAPVYVILLMFMVLTEVPRHLLSTFYVAITLLLGSAVWIVFQTTPLPGESFSHPAWKEVQSIVPDLRGTISVTPTDDRSGYLRIAAPIGVFIAGLFLFASDVRARRALMVIATAGGVIAIGSILQFVLSPEALLLATKTAYLDSLTGIFVNRNTAATFFGLLFLVQIAMSKNALQAIEFSRIAGRFRDRRRISFKLKMQIGAASMIVLLGLACLVALLLTKSRAGIGATLLATTLLLGLARFGRSQTRSRTRRSHSLRFSLLVWIAGMLAIPVTFFALSGRVLRRTEVAGFNDARFCVMPDMWRLARDQFPFGSGLASFIEIFPAYRDYHCGITGVWDMAHNFYIEGLITLGIGFPILIGLAICWLALVFVTGLRIRQRFRFGAEIGVASLALVLVHSAFDFSLQISGLAIFYAALLAPLATLSLNPRAKLPPLSSSGADEKSLKTDL